MPAVPPNRPHSTAAMPPPPRPDSPTFNRLLGLAKEEQKGKLVVPIVPAQVRRATVEEWGAVNTFAANMHEADSHGLMRRAGEFFQTFTSKPKDLDYAANHEIHYNPGGKIEPMPASVFPPGTTEMVHSHPPVRGGPSAFPSAQDYLGTYLINNGNERGIGSILFDVQSGHYFAFEGKVNPNTNLPEFTRITQPTHQDNNEWMIKHGHMDPPTPPHAAAPQIPRNHSEEMFFGPMDGVGDSSLRVPANRLPPAAPSQQLAQTAPGTPLEYRPAPGSPPAPHQTPCAISNPPPPNYHGIRLHEGEALLGHDGVPYPQSDGSPRSSGLNTPSPLDIGTPLQGRGLAHAFSGSPASMSSEQLEAYLNSLPPLSRFPTPPARD